MSMDTPLLLIAWRRTHSLRLVIDAIRPVAPTRLFVACDGPNPDRPSEAEKVAATRAVIEQEIDWPCQIERLYSDVNQGCRLGVSRAITWFFEQVEEGIILEDDCVPHPDFFRFSANLLAKYRDEPRVWAINGNNFGAEQLLFSHKPWAFIALSQAWGWATWKDRWRRATDGIFCRIDSEDPAINLKMFDDTSRKWLVSKYARNQKLNHLRAVAEGFDTWDYLWHAIVLANEGLCVIPGRNLISNIGDGVDATHIREADPRTNINTYSLLLGDTFDVPGLRLNRKLNQFYMKHMGLTGRPLAIPAHAFRKLVQLLKMMVDR